jgi:histidine triad (HIT) family protein
MDSNCLFCKIIRNEIESSILFEDEAVKVFADIHPKAPVHMLIVPKKHIVSAAVLTEADNHIPAELIFAAQKTATMLKLEGYRLVVNVGRKGGQVIDHIHMHLLGGWGEKPAMDV